jgi:adenylosuccinate synthase
MAFDVLLGLQWGDEGKGKIVDVLSEKYDIVARFQGGPNAGHSLKFDNENFVLHLIPSGIFREGVKNLIGNGVVVDPVTLINEIKVVENFGINVKDALYISHKAHLILPTHKLLDKASEIAKGKNKIGSTLKGIGPAYMDKIGRNALRFGNIFMPDFKERYERLKQKHLKLIDMYTKELKVDLTDVEEEWFEALEKLKDFKIINGEYFINDELNAGKNILAEGAQGTLLDIDFGTYPYVTSSNTIAAAISTGLGVAPTKINKIYGIFKAYITRVGSGPFPTELFDGTGDKLRELGGEYGATTGRPRRCGWMDLVALKYAVMLNGVSDLIVTKSDVLSGFDTVKMGVAYKLNGEITSEMPFDVAEVEEVVYKEFAGWRDDLSQKKTFDELPQEFKDYLTYIERETNTPISMISTGPDRSEIIYK